MVSNQMLTLDVINLASINTVRTLGLILDQDVSFIVHIKHICRIKVLYLHSMSEIRNILSLTWPKSKYSL